MRTVYWAWSMARVCDGRHSISALPGYGAFYAANKLEDEGSTINDDVFMGRFRYSTPVFGYITILSGLVLLDPRSHRGHRKWRLGRHGVLFRLLFIQLSSPGSGSSILRPSGFSIRSTRC